MNSCLKNACTEMHFFVMKIEHSLTRREFGPRTPYVLSNEHNIFKNEDSFLFEHLLVLLVPNNMFVLKKPTLPAREWVNSRPEAERDHALQLDKLQEADH